MVFQGFSFFAMALVSVGVIAYHFYKNRGSYLYESPHNNYIYSYPNELHYNPSDDEENRVQKRKTKVETCSICMDLVQSSAVSLPSEIASSAVCLPCKHLFHAKCLATWLNTNKTCPNCRAPVPAFTI